MKARPQIEIRKADENEYYFVFKLPSGGIFMSKFFEDLEEVFSAAEKIKRRASEESCYLCKNGITNQYYFVFYLKQDSPIGHSSIYKDKVSMDAEMHYMQEHLKEAEVLDLTS